MRFSSPHGDFSFSIDKLRTVAAEQGSFRPLTGISLFLYTTNNTTKTANVFSSPHGDFSFSITEALNLIYSRAFSSPHGDFSFSMFPFRTMYELFFSVFVPSRGFLFFYKFDFICHPHSIRVFVPSRGFLFFYPKQKY